MTTLTDAIRKTADALCISERAAKVKIIEACHALDIQAYWRGEYPVNPYALASGKLIPCREWSGADIDVAGEVLILADGERKAGINLDTSDFEAWLTAHAAPTASDRQAQPGGKLARRAARGAQAIWGNEGPPAHMKPKVICREIRDLVRNEDGAELQADDKTIMRGVRTIGKV